MQSQLIGSCNLQLLVSGRKKKIPTTINSLLLVLIMKDLGIIQIAWKLKRKASKAGKNLYSRAHYHLIVETKHCSVRFRY